MTDEFRNNLIRLRKELGYNQEQFAKASGVAASSLRNYEAGRTEPTVSTLRLLAKALHVDYNELIGGHPGNREISEKLGEVIDDLRDYARR